MRDRAITNSNNHLSFFRKNESIPLAIDNSYLDFEIPTAEELYRQLIWQDSYTLICSLSIEEIISFLLDFGCDINLLEEEYDTFTLPDSRNYYAFSFKPCNDWSEQNFKVREKLIDAFAELRYSEGAIKKDELFLDKNTPIQLHLSSKLAHTFAAQDKWSDIPVSYRANCLYDLIVRELYKNYLNLDKNSDYLISDYLSIHTNEFVFLDKEDGEYLVRNNLINCLHNITGDRNAAILMEEASRQAQSEEYFTRGLFSIIPLSPSAILHTNPEKQKRRETLNQYSHHYCALIQYRYLLDLKSIFEKSNWLKKENDSVRNQMIKWENFRTQPIVATAERLIEKISELSKKAGKSILLAWEEGVMEIPGAVVYIHLIPTYRSNTMDRNHAISITQSFILEHSLLLGRSNYYQDSKSEGYTNGYLLYIRKEVLAKFHQQLNPSAQIISSKKRGAEESVANEANHIQLRKLIARVSNLAAKPELQPTNLNALMDQAAELKSNLAQDEVVETDEFYNHVVRLG